MTGDKLFDWEKDHLTVTSEHIQVSNYDCIKMVKRASMFLPRAFRINVVVTTGVVLLLVLPVSGACQSESVLAAESSEMIEEVLVLGSKSLVKLKLEMYRAEDALYDLYSSLNTDDEFDIHCYKEAPTGSHIKRRVCRPNFLTKLLREETQRMMRGEPYVYPTAAIKKMNEHMLADMTETALEHPELLNVIVRYSETKQTLESERKRRCEGRFLICRSQ